MEVESTEGPIYLSPAYWMASEVSSKSLEEKAIENLALCTLLSVCGGKLT